MRLTRRELRRLIESVVNEEEKKDQQLFIAAKYIPYGDSAHDAEALRDKILESGKLKSETKDMLDRSRPGHELNHNNIVALCQIGGLSVQGSHLCKTRGKNLIDKGVIVSDFDSKGATVAYRQIEGFDVDQVKKALINGLHTIGLRDGVSVNVGFKG